MVVLHELLKTVLLEFLPDPIMEIVPLLINFSLIKHTIVLLELFYITLVMIIIKPFLEMRFAKD